MSKIQVSAKMRIPRGKIEEFKEAVADYIKQVKEKDTGTLQADWFLSSDGIDAEIRTNPFAIITSHFFINAITYSSYF